MQKLFEAFKFCPNCGAELMTQKGYKNCPACNTSHFFNPKATVGGILINEKGEFLLVKRSVEPYKDYWDAPGGFVDMDENLEQALIREVKEETGLDIKDPTYLESIYENYLYQEVEYPVVGSVFIAKINSKDKVQVGDDAYDYQFFTKENMPLDKIAFENQTKLFKRYLAQN